MSRLYKIALGLLTLLMLVSVSAYAIDTEPMATVSFLEGRASMKSSLSGEWLPVTVGTRIGASFIVRTDKGAKLELKLPDGSILRLAPGSEVVMKSLIVPSKKSGGGDKSLFTLKAGKLWANVAKAIGNERKFDVTTGNAVAGVRGTIFRVDALEAEATLVRVYAGAVAVASTVAPLRNSEDGKATRREVSPPREVSKKEFEELVAKAMQEVRVAADGMIKLGEFTGESEKDDTWVVWNLGRDAESGIPHTPEEAPAPAKAPTP